MANILQPPAVKISGYLDKKARLRIGSPWKKYWFVLEGRLLLYYRSKDEYETLSPCKGSINLCPPCNIHPSSSTNCIFQIECRASTVTLRAENRSEQDKWMQALLAAIDQSKSSPNRMSHFRYSLDDLPTPTRNKKKIKNEFFRQNSMPHRSSKQNSQIMVERLQNIGAHTYGGSLETIVRLSIKNNDMNLKNDIYATVDPQNMDFNTSNHKTKDINPDHYIIENDQYSIIQEENSIDMLSHVDTLKQSPSAMKVTVENCEYAGCDEIDNNTVDKDETVENEHYISCCMNPNDRTLQNQKREKVEHLYERISKDFSPSEKKDKNTLSTGNLYEVLLDDNDNLDTQNINDQYSVVQKKNAVKTSNKSNEKDVGINIDHNKNSLIIDNEQYISNRNSIESEYSEAKIITADYMIAYDTIDKNMEQETIYEDVDILKRTMYDSKTDVYPQNLEPVLPPRRGSKMSEEETSSQSSSHDTKVKQKRKLFKMFNKIDKKGDGNEVKKSKLKKRSTSFLRKMWRRKTKSLDNDDDIIYETVDYELVKRQVQHQSDIEMLEELQKILQLRKDILQQKLKANETKLNGDKKDITEKWIQETIECKDDALVVETSNDENRPILPPRQSLQSSSDNKLEILPENQKNSEHLQSIDEILKDLDKQAEGNKKVKQLIEKFNDIKAEEEVVKRRKAKTELSKSLSDSKVFQIINTRRDSDELNKLLEELAKFTNAPIMTPGVTSSLTTPIISDEEWLNLIPIRRRRSSDPDYDVPRPHSSLQIFESTKPNLDNPIPVTRFFGPILPQSPINTNITSSASMDPDSLETHSNIEENNIIKPLIRQNLIQSPTTPEREHNTSSSHTYFDHDIIYAHPKNLFSNIDLTINNNDKIADKNEKNYINNNNNNEDGRMANENIICAMDLSPEEVFIDSLEPITEISTIF